MNKYLIIIFLVLDFISANMNYACSGFYLMKDSTMFFCKNEDWTDWRSKIWFVPATDTSFGYVCFGFELPELSDGMNDKGLIVSHFSGYEKLIRKSIDKPFYPGVLSELVLAKCETIDEVKNLLNHYNLELFHNGMIMFADRYGNSIIAEGDTIIEKKYYYQICTNIYQSEYNEENTPDWRFNNIRQQILSNKNITFDFCKNTLESVEQEITQFSIIYNVRQLEFSVYLFQDFRYRADFNLINQLKKGKHVYDLYTFFPAGSRYHQVYIKRQAPQNNIFICMFLVICGIIFLYTIIVWPLSRFLKNIEYNERNEKRPKISLAKIWSFIICALLFIYLIALVNFKEAFQIGLPLHIDNFPFVIRFNCSYPFAGIITYCSFSSF